ncbi:MAG: acetate/propionate family kinase [Burkholderiales bacterium]|nr:acetate/propionate family kinase [Burkholderiales bacterium]
MEAILVINAGSSSIKFSVFATSSIADNMLYHGTMDIGTDATNFTISDLYNTKQEIIPTIDYNQLFTRVIENISQQVILVAVGHRVVHGGTYFKAPVIITPSIYNQLEELVSLAPLHQGHNLNAIKIITNLQPNLPQIACFDTSFHHTQQHLAKLFAIPQILTKQGIIRYGFHGLSYEYIASVINNYIGTVGNERVIVQHLGNGSSACAMYQHKSVASSMGFTALDGLMMGTRCGNIDPGVILYLLEEKQYSLPQITELLYHKSGLLGVSNGLSSDMRKLLISDDLNAKEAIELFCYRAACEIGHLCVALGGCDALVFSAGIGEHAALVRQKICAYLTWLGLGLDEQANNNHQAIISTKDSKIVVSIIPTNEEYMIAKHVQQILLTSA